MDTLDETYLLLLQVWLILVLYFNLELPSFSFLADNVDCPT